MTPTAIARREMVTLLAIMDRTHSQLMDAVPEKCGLPNLNKDNESILEQVTDVVNNFMLVLHRGPQSATG